MAAEERDGVPLTNLDQELFEQGGLPDPGRALHLDDARPPLAGVAQQRVEGAELQAAADERVHGRPPVRGDA